MANKDLNKLKVFQKKFTDSPIKEFKVIRRILNPSLNLIGRGVVRLAPGWGEKLHLDLF